MARQDNIEFELQPEHVNPRNWLVFTGILIVVGLLIWGMPVKDKAAQKFLAWRGIPHSEAYLFKSKNGSMVAFYWKEDRPTKIRNRKHIVIENIEFELYQKEP